MYNQCSNLKKFLLIASSTSMMRCGDFQSSAASSSSTDQVIDSPISLTQAQKECLQNTERVFGGKWEIKGMDPRGDSVLVEVTYNYCPKGLSSVIPLNIAPFEEVPNMDWYYKHDVVPKERGTEFFPGRDKLVPENLLPFLHSPGGMYAAPTEGVVYGTYTEEGVIMPPLLVLQKLIAKNAIITI